MAYNIDETNPYALYQKSLMEESHPYRSAAWTRDQSVSMNEKDWDAETKKPTGYLNHIPIVRLAQTEVEEEKKEEKKAEEKKDAKAAPAKKDDKKAAPAKKEDAKKDAKKGDAKKDAKKGDAKKGDAKKDDKKKKGPHPYRKHAWTEEQHDKSHPKEWEEETKKPSGYQKALGAALNQNLYPGETKSTIAPYFQGDHAWGKGNLPYMNEKEW